MTATKTDPNELLTRRAAANILGFPPGRLAIWASKNRGPKFLKLGRNVRYRRSDIDDYLARAARPTREHQ